MPDAASQCVSDDDHDEDGEPRVPPAFRYATLLTRTWQGAAAEHQHRTDDATDDPDELIDDEDILEAS